MLRQDRTHWDCNPDVGLDVMYDIRYGGKWTVLEGELWFVSCDDRLKLTSNIASAFCIGISVCSV